METGGGAPYGSGQSFRPEMKAIEPFPPAQL